MTDNIIALEYEKEEFSPLKGEKFRSWFLTINKSAYTESINYENMKNYIDENLSLKYACWNEEMGDSGNIHIHLYFELGSPVSFNSIKKKFPGANIQKRKGNPSESRRYVMKPEGVLFKGVEKSHTKVKEFQEIGDFTPFAGIMTRGEKKPKKTMNEKVDEIIENCNSFLECCKYDAFTTNQMQRVIDERLKEKKLLEFKESNCTYYKSQNGKGELITVHRKVYYLFGNTGCGKTFGVMSKYGSDQTCIIEQICEGMNYDEYDYQPVLMFDEFYSQINISTILNLLDNTKIGVLKRRYSNALNLSDTIILTSNYPFEKQYEYERKIGSTQYNSFVRRFNGGIWEMFQTPKGDRYIACHTDLTKMEERHHKKYDLSEPPVDTRFVKIVSVEELQKIKDECPF